MREPIIKGTPDRRRRADAATSPTRRPRPRRTPIRTRSSARSGSREVVGQRAVAERLAISLAAAQEAGRAAAPHPLRRAAGAGQDDLRHRLAQRAGRRAEHHQRGGARQEDGRDALPHERAEGSILFIDEIHRLPSAVEEFIYPVMEDFRVDVVLGEGMSARTINLPLKKFTIIGATTRSGMLSGPLRERFGMHEHLEFYDVEDLATDHHDQRRQAPRRRSCPKPPGSWPRAAEGRLGSPMPGCDGSATTRLARADGHISLSVARDALAMQEVDAEGLDKQDRRYLETLIRVFGGGPTGVEAMAATMNVAVDTLKDEVEPYLLRREYVVRTPRGRQATAAAYLHLGLPEPRRPSRTSPMFDPQRRLFE